MTKDVLLSIRGLQFDGVSDGGDVETVTPAEYYRRNDSHYVVYKEAAEGFSDLTNNIIKWNDRAVDLTKRGLVNAHLKFEKNKKSITDYRTPFGNILIGIDTKDITMKEDGNRIQLDVDYSLDINYEYLADCKITMMVNSKESAT